jgi:hypothetical protein
VTRVWSFEPGADDLTQLAATNRVAFTAQSGHLGVWSLTEFKPQPAMDYSAPITDVLAIDDSALVSTSEGLLHGVLRTHDKSAPRRLASCRAGAAPRPVDVPPGAR